MKKENTQAVNTSAPFQSVKNAARITGLSEFFLRNGLKAGTIPFVKSGNKYLIHVPRLLEQLNATVHAPEIHC